MSVINNYNDNTLVSGTSSADSIENYGSMVTLNAGGGNDYLRTNFVASNVTMNGGAGDDIIYSNGSNTSANGGAGNDSIYNNGSNNTVDGGDGNDILRTGFVTSTNVTLNGGKGNDTIYNTGSSSVVLNGDADNDYIRTDSITSDVTINGGAGKDSLYTNGSSVAVNGDDGNDYLNNWRNTYGVTMNGGVGDDTLDNNGFNAVINGGAGNDRIYNDSLASNDTLNGGAGNDTVYNHASNVLIDGGDGNDLLWTGYDTSNNVTLNTGAGNDTVDIWSAGKNTVNVGEGSNLLRVLRDNELIVNGSDANESLLIYADREKVYHSMPDIAMTINSSRGNDTVNGFDYARGVYSYSPNHGNDVILGFGNQSTLKVNGTIDRWSLDGSDVVFTVGQGSVRLKNGKGHVLNVSDNNGAVSTVFGGSYSYSQQDVLKDFMRSLNQTTLTSTADMVDEAINSCSKGKYKNLSAAVDAFISDCRGAKGDVDKFLQEYCGIYPDNADTGAITGWDAGGSTVKNYYNVVPLNSTKNPTV